MNWKKRQKKYPNPQNDVAWRMWVMYKLGQHTMAFKVLIPLVVIILGLVVGLWLR